MRELWSEIYQTIRRSKWRSIMTAFGIFWGMLMLVILVGMGFGFNNGIVAALKSIPANSVFFFGGTTSMAYKGYSKGRSIMLENRDIDILQSRFSNITERIVPLNNFGSFRCAYEDASEDFSVVGTHKGYFQCIPQKQLFGRYLNEMDVREQRKVCVIGYQVYRSLFKRGGDPCGKLIKAGELYYTIVGVVRESSGMINLGAGVNESIHIPLTTGQNTYGQGDMIHALIVTLKDDAPAQEWEDKILRVIKEIHYAHPDDTMAIQYFNLAEIIEMFDLLFLGIYILIWIIGAGTLLAGLIGVSNIMLVTVKERTQEIGIRRAIGATPRTILTQIMSESIVITVTAGIAGLTLGVWILQAISIVTKGSSTIENGSGTEFQGFDNPQIPFTVAVVALIILIIGGLVAGWMPANRAMKIKAIDALRDE